MSFLSKFSSLSSLLSPRGSKQTSHSSEEAQQEMGGFVELTDMPLQQHVDEVAPTQRPSALALHMAKRFSSLYASFENDPTTSDITLVYGADQLKEYHCHKALLSAHSDYFRALFYGGMLESDEHTLHLDYCEDISNDAFEDMLNFLYRGRLRVDRKNLIHYCFMAHRFQVAILSRACSHAIGTHVTNDNAVDLLHVSLMLGDAHMQAQCLNLLDHHHISAIVDSSPLSVLKTILDSSHIALTEDQIFTLIIKYAEKHNLSTEQTSDLCRVVRLPQMPSKQLLRLIKPHIEGPKALFDKTLFQEALEFHLFPTSFKERTEVRFTRRQSSVIWETTYEQNFTITKNGACITKKGLNGWDSTAFIKCGGSGNQTIRVKVNKQLQVGGLGIGFTGTSSIKLPQTFSSWCGITYYNQGTAQHPQAGSTIEYTVDRDADLFRFRIDGQQAGTGALKPSEFTSGLVLCVAPHYAGIELEIVS